MSKEKRLTPKLRFPEFVRDGKWEEDFLGNRGDFIGGGTPSKKNKSYWRGHIPWVSSSDISEDTIYHIDKTRFITKDAIKKSATKLVPKNSLLIVSRVGVGKVGITKEKICTSQDFTNFTPLKDDIFFLGYYLKSCSNVLLKFSQGMAIKGFTKDDISNLTLPFPDNTQEQQKIAACLYSLDELITVHNNKLEALKDHKKGLLQNLFPQEGEKVPKYRFPEFENDGEWVEKKLGDAADFINGRAYKKKELLPSGKYRVLRVGNFFTNNEWYYSDLELDEDKYCAKGDLLYAWSASFGPHIWKEEKVIYHYHIWKVIEKKEIDKQFLFVLLDFETENIKAAQARGLGMQHLTKSGIESWESTIPPTEKEQQKIATCLLVVDNLISAQHEKVEHLQQHKKGLMQGLFPIIVD